MKMSDSTAIFALKSDGGVTERYGQEPHRSIVETRKWIRERLVGKGNVDSLFWVFVPKTESRAIGSCCFWNFDQEFGSAELGYEMHPSFWGKGIMSEALPPVISYGFGELGFHRIEACPIDDNAPSKGVLTKLGFKYEGTLRQKVFFRGRFLDLAYYGLLNNEWKPTSNKEHFGNSLPDDNPL